METLTSRTVWVRWLGPVLLSIIFSMPFVQAGQAVPDVRVLIDVSGSMKQNDPHNLRIPASKLLIGLIPAKTRAGLWTFAGDVKNMARVATVDDLWKIEARRASGAIHSQGLYTDIELAIREAIRDWQTVDTRYDRNLIVLTDGMVDVSKDATASVASRQRIIDELLPRLKQAGIRVHTIALSPNADHELLRAMAMTTDGWFEQVDDAAKLQRLFLRLFEKSVPADTVPLKDNRFSIDSSISDMTLLVFRADATQVTELIAPDNSVWSKASHPAGVTWFVEAGYDMITVKAPRPGYWSINAPADDDNRVMIVTNLKLQLSELPNNLMISQGLSLTAELQQQGKTIDRKRFLDLIDFHASQKTGEVLLQYGLNDAGMAPDEQAGDGRYSLDIPPYTETGEYELIITAQSPTFQRQVRHHLRIYDKAVKVELLADEQQQAIRLEILVEPGILKPDSLQATLHYANGSRAPISGDLDSGWNYVIPASFAGQTVTIKVKASSYQGKPFFFEVERVVPSLPQTEVTEAPVPEPEPEPEPQAPAETAAVADVATQAPPLTEEKGMSWWLISILLIVGNGLLFGGGYFAWRWWKQRGQADVEQQQSEIIEAGASEDDKELVIPPEGLLSVDQEELEATARQDQEALAQAPASAEQAQPQEAATAPEVAPTETGPPGQDDADPLKDLDSFLDEHKELVTDKQDAQSDAGDSQESDDPGTASGDQGMLASTQADDDETKPDDDIDALIEQAHGESADPADGQTSQSEQHAEAHRQDDAVEDIDALLEQAQDKTQTVSEDVDSADDIDALLEQTQASATTAQQGNTDTVDDIDKLLEESQADEAVK